MEKNTGFFIDNIFYFDNEISTGTIFQKCADKRIDLPCFCYHESLSIAGNCRMCLVETSNSQKLVVSCAMPLIDDIKIYTNNNRVKKARESVLEFLLINHPLDCPICDQGGECDLQDITLVFGSDKSRFYEYSKRAIFDRECGPLIKMLMTRCIHCTRCVRFLHEIAGTNDFGMLGRGEQSEIGTYVNNYLVDELSGNIIDLCPVGALTSKPYAFRARPWELNSLESIDILDSMASNIRIDFLNNKVYRILPIYDSNVNEDWITNKARFSYDSNLNQRFYYPMLKINDKFVMITWKKAFYFFFYYFFKNLKNNIIAIYGMFSDIDNVIHMNKFFNLIGLEISLYDNSNKFDFRKYYLIENIINIFENIYNIFLIGINLRLELPLLNSRLRRYVNNSNKINVFSIGLSNLYNNIKIKSFGNSLSDFFNIIKGKCLFNLNIFYNNYLNIFNSSILKLNNIIFLFSPKIFSKFFRIIDYTYILLNKHLYCKLYNLISDINTINIFEQNNFKKFVINKNFFNFIFLENIDNKFLLEILKYEKNFVVYHGHFFDIGAEYSNLLLPSLSNFEYNANFINIEGRIRKLTKVISKDTIVNYELFIILKLYNFYYLKNNFSLIKYFSKIILFFDFLLIDWNINIKYYRRGLLNKEIFFYDITKKYICIYNNLFDSLIYNYYKNDIYSFNSKNMHLSSIEFLNRLKTFV